MNHLNATGFYKIQKSNLIKYGLLYNKYVVFDARNITIFGWHIPTISEFNSLITYLGGASVAGGKLKETGLTYWNSPNTGATNEVGFDGRGSGYRITSGSFSALNVLDYLWTSTPSYDPTTVGTSYLMRYDNASLAFQNINNKIGNSIRPVKDSTTLTAGQTGIYVGTNGQKYPTIGISISGSVQEWLSVNLAETKYRNGDSIPEVTNNTDWAALSSGALCAFNNDWNNVFI